MEIDGAIIAIKGLIGNELKYHGHVRRVAVRLARDLAKDSNFLLLRGRRLEDKNPSVDDMANQPRK